MRLHPVERWTWTAAVAAVLALGTAAETQAQDAATHARISAFEEWDLTGAMEEYGVPGVSIAVLRDGELSWAKGYGVLQAGGNEPVDTETVFSVGSVSKVGAAATTLRLVDRGRLNLDTDVNEYLTSWKVPENDYTRAEPVTLRRILTHTAGLTVHGFADFQPGEELPTTVQILASDGPAKNPPVFVDIPVGSRFRYSGGGTTVQQLVIEDVTRMPFHEAAERFVFGPLGMERSSYRNPLPEAHGNIARAHGPDGRPRALPRGYEAMPEAAASGLWTTPSDLTRLLIAFLESHAGSPDAFLSPRIAEQVMTEHQPGGWGLGPDLGGRAETFRFMHGGANNSYKAWFEVHVATGNGIVIFTNGQDGDDLWAEIVQQIERAEGWPEGIAGR